MSRKFTRRTLLKGAAAGGFGLLILRDSKTAFTYEANEKLNIGIIGCGGMGDGNTRGVSSENIVGLCDVDDERSSGAKNNYPDGQVFADFRRMLDRMHRQIDAVVVSTPDHTHATAAAMAMRMGMHVYCEKPLTWSIHEARVLRDLARKHKVATQMGNRGMSSGKFREAVEVVTSGAIGQVYDVHIWSDRPIWPQGVNRPDGTHEVPGHLHWDLWLGPAPERPYAPGYHPFSWRGWIDFGTGAIGDMGCHTFNMPFTALDLKNPVSVEAEVFEMSKESFPKRSIVRYSFGQRGNLRPVRVTWYDGGLRPSPALLMGHEVPGSGSLLIGDKGVLFSPGDGGTEYRLLPEDRFSNFQLPPQTLPRSPGHYEEWVRACKGGEPAMSNFDHAAPLTETLLLGNLAIITGQPIYFDPENMRAINCPKADYFINRPYRRGWTL